MKIREVGRLAMRRWCWCVAAAAATAAGCGDGVPEGTVASVGERHIAAEDLTAAVQRLYPDGLATDEQAAAARTKALDALIARELLLREGLARGLGEDPQIRGKLDELRRDLVVEEYYNRDIWAGIDIGDELVESRFDEWGGGTELRLAHILCREARDAEAVLKELAEGRDFREMARDRSLHGKSAPAGGDLGYMPAAMVFPEVLEAVEDLVVGAIHPTPIQSRMGYHVVKVLGRRRRSLAQQRSMLENTLQAEQKAALERAAWDRLGRKHALRWYPELALSMARRQELPEQQILYEWDGGQLAAADYVRLAGVPQPVFEDTAKIHSLAERLAMGELVHAEGTSQGYDQLEVVQRRLTAEREELFGARLFEDEVVSRGIDEEEALAFHDARRDQYRSPPRVTVREILVTSQPLADSLHGLVAGGEDMAQLARRFTRRADLRQTGGLWEDVDATDPRSANVYRAALGQLGLIGPIRVPGGYSVVEAIETQPGQVLEFAEAEGAVRRDIATLAMDEFLARLREKYAGDIVIR